MSLDLLSRFTKKVPAPSAPPVAVPANTDQINSVFENGHYKIPNLDPNNIQRSTGIHGEKLTSKDAYSVQWMDEETQRFLTVASDPMYRFLNTLCGVIQCEFNDVIDSEKAINVSANILKEMNQFYDNGRMASVANEIKRNRPELEMMDRKNKRRKGNLDNIMENYSSSLKSNAFDYQPFFGKRIFNKDIDFNTRTPEQFIDSMINQLTSRTYKGRTYATTKELFVQLREAVSKYLPGQQVTDDVEKQFLEIVCSIDYDVVKDMSPILRQWWNTESKLEFVHNQNDKEEKKRKTEETLKKILELGGKGPPSLGISLGVSEPLPFSSAFAALRWLIEEKQSISEQDIQLIMTLFSSEPPNSPQWTSMLHHLGNIFIAASVRASFNLVLISVRRQSGIRSLSAKDIIKMIKDENENEKLLHEEVSLKFAELVGMHMLTRRNEILIRMNNKWTHDVILEEKNLLVELFMHLKQNDNGNLYFSEGADRILSGVQRYSTMDLPSLPDNNITKTYNSIMKSLGH